MRTASLLALFFLGGLPSTQAPTAVPIKSEPNHHLVLENPYVNVFRVSFPGHAASLLHQHDVPYLYVSLGPADIMNAIQGQPERHQVLADGQVGFAPGHFAHVVRTDAGSSFNNVTIELLKPQGEPRNLCEKIIEAPLHCENDSSPVVPSDSPLQTLVQAVSSKNLFETDELAVGAFTIKADMPTATSHPRLLVVQMNSEVRVEVAGESPKTIGGGEVLWLDGGKAWTTFAPSGKAPAHFLLIAFR